MRPNFVTIPAQAFAIWSAAIAFALWAVAAMAQPRSVPFWMQGDGGWFATLNQDGSWTVGDDIAQAVGSGAYKADELYRCIVDGLIATPPYINQAPDNSQPMSDTERRRVIRSDPILARCLPSEKPMSQPSLSIFGSLCTTLPITVPALIVHGDTVEIAGHRIRLAGIAADVA